MATPNPKDKLGAGGRFAAISQKVAQSEEKKGVSPKKAKQIGDATAAKIGRAKYGNAKMGQLAKAGKKP